MRLIFLAALAYGFSGLICANGTAQPVDREVLASSALREVTPTLWVESGMSADQIAHLMAAEKWARAAVEHTYGSVTSNPVIYAFASEMTYRRFGGGVRLAYFDGDRIMVSPRGLKGHFIAHEWSHAEMQQRLSLEAYLHLPAWFDEGLAVLIGDAPETSAQHWQWLIAHAIPRPQRAELLSLNTPSQWEDAIYRYGEDQNMQRLASGEPQQRPVYTAAGQELRRWFDKAGTTGLLQMINVLNADQEFLNAYQQYAP